MFQGPSLVQRCLVATEHVILLQRSKASQTYGGVLDYLQPFKPSVSLKSFANLNPSVNQSLMNESLKQSQICCIFKVGNSYTNLRKSMGWQITWWRLHRAFQASTRNTEKWHHLLPSVFAPFSTELFRLPQAHRIPFRRVLSSFDDNSSVGHSLMA